MFPRGVPNEHVVLLANPVRWKRRIGYSPFCLKGVGPSVTQWRKRRDSNPRYGCPYASFQVWDTRPGSNP